MAAASLEQRISQAKAYWRLVVRYKWRILVGICALTLAFTVIIAKLPNIYEATTTILVDPQQIPEKYVTTVTSTDPYSRLNTITQQVLSRTRLQEIIDKLDLYSDLRRSISPEELIEKMRDDITIQAKEGTGPELSTFTITYQGKQRDLVSQVANELANSFIRWNVSTREEQVAGTKEFLSSELEAAKKSLEQQEDALRQFKVSHLGETPDQAAYNLQFLAGLRSALQANVDAMNRWDEERALSKLSLQVTTAGANPNVDRTPRASVDLTPRASLELEKRQVEATIKQLRERYSDRYPDVVRATSQLEDIESQLKSLPAGSVDHTDDSSDTSGAELTAAVRPAPVDGEIERPKAEKNQIQSGSDQADHSSDVGRAESAPAVRPVPIDGEMERLTAERNRIQSQIEEYQAKLEAAPLREEQLVELTRNYDISKQNYQALLDKSFSIGMASDLEQKQKGERFTVLDPAQVPGKPVKPKRKELIPVSALVALALPILLVVAKETFSPAIKTEMELKSLLPAGVRVMGLIPRIEIAADWHRNRRLAVSASLVCILLCLAIINVIWRIHLML